MAGRTSLSPNDQDEDMTATRFQIDPGRETQRRRGRQRKEGISSVPWPSGSGCWGQTTPTRPEPHRLTSQLEAQGYLAAARTLCERALAIQERVLGPDHPDTATGLNDLAFLL